MKNSAGFYATIDEACGLFKESLDAASHKELAAAEQLLDRAYRRLKEASGMSAVGSEAGPARMLAASYLLVAKNFHHLVGRSDKARLVAEKSVVLLENCGGADEEFFEALDLLARIALEDGEIKAYESLACQALAAAERLYGRWHPVIAKWMLHLGDARREQGDEAGARKIHQEAIEMVERAVGPEHELVAQLKELTGFDFAPPQAQPAQRPAESTVVAPAPPTIDVAR